MSKADTARHAPEEVDAYLAELPDEERSALERVRGIVREIAPECHERVSYGIPIFRLRTDLVGLSASKHHLSLHVMSTALTKALAQEIEGLQTSGATIHFTPEAPLSRELIERIVRARMVEMGIG